MSPGFCRETELGHLASAWTSLGLNCPYGGWGVGGGVESGSDLFNGPKFLPRCEICLVPEVLPKAGWAVYYFWSFRRSSFGLEQLIHKQM